MTPEPFLDHNGATVKFGPYSLVRYGDLYAIPCGLRLASGDFEPAAALLGFSTEGVFRAGEPRPLVAAPTVLMFAESSRAGADASDPEADKLAYELSRDGLDWGIVVASTLLDELAQLYQFPLPRIDASTQVRCRNCRRALPRSIAV